MAMRQARSMAAMGGGAARTPLRVRSDHLPQQIAEATRALEMLGVPQGTKAGPPAPPPEPGSWLTVSGAERVQMAGGQLAQNIMHPSFTPFEQLWRRQAQQSFFSPAVTPENPVSFELGAFQVPQQMVLLLADYRFDIYVPSGAFVGDSHPIPDRSLSTIMGYDVNIDQLRDGNVQYQVDPVPIQDEQQQAFTPTGSTGIPNPVPTIASLVSGPQLQPASAFELALFARSAQAGPGLGLLPQRHERQGPLPYPWTFFVKEGQVLQCKAFIFRPIPFPVAFIEADVSGVLLPASQLEAMMRSMAPLQSQGGGY